MFLVEIRELKTWMPVSVGMTEEHD